MHTLLFLYNELQSPSWQREAKVPLEFISFAFAQGKLYTHMRKNSSFLLEDKKTWGNDVVYGGLFLLRDDDFYIRSLDAYNVCSLSTLRKNHVLDVHHRKEVVITPIAFKTREQFVSLQYLEGESITAYTYTANPNHPKITQRLRSSRQHRIVQGVDKQHFNNLIREVHEHDR